MKYQNWIKCKNKKQLNKTIKLKWNDIKIKLK